MSKIARKFSMIAVGIILVMGMTATSFAASIGTSDATNVTTSDTTLNIAKGLDVSNAALSKVDGPGITFTYSVAPTTVASGTTITDAGNNTATVHSGVANGLSVTGNPSFPTGTAVNASASGTENTKNIVLSVDLTKFSSPGIYRYTLTDTTAAADLRDAGIVRTSNFETVRYVDVYIERSGSGLAVAGYVVGSDKDGNGVLVKEIYETITPTDNGTAADTTDSYRTYNLTLSKSVTGNMGDRNNEFTFAGTLANQSKYYYAKKNSAPTISDTSSTAASLSTTLKHGDTYYVYGLSPKATVAWTETNNTTDTYKVTVNGTNGSALVAQSSVAASGTKALAATAVTNYDTANASGVPTTVESATSQNVENVTFENNFESVSPTGIVMRYGAPILILLVGIAFFFTYRRTRREVDSE